MLGYLAENKGTDLQKSQLQAVLETYFKDVPDLTDMSDTEILNTELETLAKYGTHNITVKEIFDGNIAGSSKIKAATIFEDKAGDEEGATEGKIHIGDYVNYNPVAIGETGTESKYTYQSSNNYTGIAEAIGANKVTGFTDSSQDFTVKSNLKWQVIGIDGDNILITTESLIIPDNPITFSGNTGYGLYGAKAYENCSQNTGERNEINNISQIYKYGKGSDKNKARGITIEDVNKITGVTADGSSITPSGLYTGPTGYEYGKTINNYKKGESDGWTPHTWLTASATDRADSTKSPGISGKITSYYYNGSNSSLKTANSTIRKNLLFGEYSTGFKLYWLASNGFHVESNNVPFFGPGFVYYGNAYSLPKRLFDTDGTEFGDAIGVRPVIYLDSNVSLTPTGTENNITTWNID